MVEMSNEAPKREWGLLGNEMHLDVCPLRQPDIEMVIKETHEKKAESLKHLDRYGFLSMDIWIQIYRDYREDLKGSSPYLLVYERFWQVQRSFYWAMVDLTCGAYFNAAQMLRLIFESMIVSVYFYYQYPDSLDKQKKALTKRTQGQPKFYILVRGLPKEWEKETRHLRRIWSELNKRVHMSLTGFETYIQSRGTQLEGYKTSMFYYDESLFDQTEKLVGEVMDSTFALALTTFPRARRAALDSVDTAARHCCDLNLRLTKTVLQNIS